jgi:hypothetical protein
MSNPPVDDFSLSPLYQQSPALATVMRNLRKIRTERELFRGFDRQTLIRNRGRNFFLNPDFFRVFR